MTHHHSHGGCLVVEDQALIGMALEAFLEDAGLEASLVSSGAQALSWLETATPDFVVLDYSLKDGPCTELARELVRRAVPFIIYSGHRRLSLPVEFGDIVWIEKPAPRETLLTAIVAQHLRQAA
jgi:DNA-binding response OmpR family regulator